MKVLLDENMAPRLRLLLSPHDAYTVDFLGWKGLKNGVLLAHAEAAAFQAFITVDKNLSYQQNISHPISAWSYLVQIYGQRSPLNSVASCKR